MGDIGEDIACKWLTNHGYLVVERNYLKKWGELDIIATKDRMIHFVEVKSIVLKEGRSLTGHRPEENVHELKIRRLKRVIQSYLLEKHHGVEVSFEFHVLVVSMNPLTRRARVKHLENIIL